MKKQKKGFINFICSLIPGAGELNMGFEKQGLSILIVFWGIVAMCAVTGTAFFATLLPIVWIYSFFHTHNLKNMSEEDFGAEEDRYLFRLDYIMDNRKELWNKYYKVIAGVFIVAGVCMIGREMTDLFWYVIPQYISETLYRTLSFFSAAAVGCGIIIVGILMLHKKADTEE